MPTLRFLSGTRNIAWDSLIVQCANKQSAICGGSDVVVMKPMTLEAILGKVKDMLIEKQTFMQRKSAKFQRRK